MDTKIPYTFCSKAVSFTVNVFFNDLLLKYSYICKVNTYFFTFGKTAIHPMSMYAQLLKPKPFPIYNFSDTCKSFEKTNRKYWNLCDLNI